MYIPLNIEYGYHLNSDWRVFAATGIGLRYRLYDSEKYPDSNVETVKNVDIHRDFNVTFEVGCGVQWKKFQLRYNFAKGLTDEFDTPVRSTYSKYPYTFSLTYLL